MKNLLLILTLALSAQQSAPPPATQGVARITGTVRRSGSGDLLENVQIILSGPPGRYATSDRQGRFVFKDVPAGTYFVSTGQLDGYTRPPKAPANQRVVVTAGQTSMDNVDFELVQGGSVRGRLLMPDGEPLPRVNVKAVHPFYKNGQRSLQPSGTSVQTDDRGNYRIFGIEPGDYFVVAVALPTGGPADDLRAKLTDTFFPGASDEDSAVLVKIGSGAESTADFKMLTSSKVTVSGKVIDNVPNSTSLNTFFLVPRDSRTVVMYPKPHMAPGPMNGGEFELRDVEAGSYYLYASAYAKAGVSGAAKNFIGRTVIDVGSQDVAGVTVVIQPNVDIAGRISLDAGSSPANVAFHSRLSMTLRPKDSLPVFTGSQVRVDENGAFTIAGVPEMTYQIAALPLIGLPQGAYLADIRQGSKSVLDDGFFDAAAAGPPLEIILRLNGGTVDGVVRNSAGKVVEAASVTLVPTAVRRQNALLYKRAVTDANGHFNIQGITPGDYKLFAWDLPPSGADEYPDFMMKYEALGQPLSVSVGATVSISAVIIPSSPQ